MEQRDCLNFKKKLGKLREEILLGTGGQEFNQFLKDVADEAEFASEMISLQIGSFTSNNHAKNLALIDQMLKKIEANSYGYCIECGEEIPLKRLKVLPLTEYCIQCQTEMENDY